MHWRALRLPEGAALAWACVMLLLLALAGPVRAEVTPADVTQLQVQRQDDGVHLTAAVRFDLPAVVEDALTKGIPMFFVAEAAVYRDRWYWSDKRVASAFRHMRLSFQPLTRRWRLHVSAQPIGNSGLVLGQNFDTREEALAAVQRISRWRIADLNEVEPDTVHHVEFRFRLDMSQLPRPFQIGAVGQSEWTIAAARNQRLVIESAR